MEKTTTTKASARDSGEAKGTQDKPAATKAAVPNKNCPNVRISEGNGISMDAKRADRFAKAMQRMYKAVHSLNVATRVFAWGDLDKDTMDPATTVRAFTAPLEADITLLFQMIENEDQPHSAWEASHAQD